MEWSALEHILFLLSDLFPLWNAWHHQLRRLHQLFLLCMHLHIFYYIHVHTQPVMDYPFWSTQELLHIFLPLPAADIPAPQYGQDTLSYMAQYLCHNSWSGLYLCNSQTTCVHPKAVQSVMASLDIWFHNLPCRRASVRVLPHRQDSFPHTCRMPHTLSYPLLRYRQNVTCSVC